MNAAIGQGEDHVVPVDWAGAGMPLSDTVSRWCSRLLGYASLAGACVGVLKLVF